MTVTPKELRQLADRDEPTLQTTYFDFVASTLELASTLERTRNHDLGRNLTSTLDKSRSLKLARSRSSDLVRARDLAGTIARALARERDPELDRARTLAKALETAVSSARPSDRDLARASALELASALALARSQDLSSDLELWDMTAAIIYVLLGVPYHVAESEKRAPTPRVPALTYRDTLGESFAETGPLRGDLEQLIGRLHQAAQDNATPEELSTRLTAHAKDGHHLFYGSDDEPREIPPEPPLVYGWTIGATKLLERAAAPSETLQPFVEKLVEEPSPTGLQEGLNVLIDQSAHDDSDDADWEYVDPFGGRLVAAIDELVLEPGNTAAVISYALILNNMGMQGPAGWVLSAFIVLLQLVRRRRDS